jgi:hypothetical protein
MLICLPSFGLIRRTDRKLTKADTEGKETTLEHFTRRRHCHKSHAMHSLKLRIANAPPRFSITQQSTYLFNVIQAFLVDDNNV